MLLHSCEAHRIVACQLGDALLGVDRTAHDVAAGVVRQRRTCDRNREGRSAFIQPYGCMAILSRDERHDAVEIGWPAMANVLVLGGGFGGAQVAITARELLGDEHRVTVVDRSDRSFLCGANPLMLVGLRPREGVSRPLSSLRDHRVEVKSTRSSPSISSDGRWTRAGTHFLSITWWWRWARSTTWMPYPGLRPPSPSTTTQAQSSSARRWSDSRAGDRHRYRRRSL